MQNKGVQQYRGPQALHDLIFTVNKPLLGKKGVHYQKLLKDWRLIVGEDMARLTIPTKISTSRKKDISENILYIATNNASVAAELIYHLALIKEQINLYFGYEYIHQIKSVQAIFEVIHNIKKEVLPLSEAQNIKLANLISEYQEDDEIKNILTKLGIGVLQK